MKLSDFDKFKQNNEFLYNLYVEEFEQLLFQEYDVSFFTKEFFQSERGNYYRYVKPLYIYLKIRIELEENINMLENDIYLLQYQ